MRERSAEVSEAQNTKPETVENGFVHSHARAAPNWKLGVNEKRARIGVSVWVA